MADVVGLLRTVLTLDTASFTTEAKKAEAATVSLDKTLAQLGKETDRLSAQGEKLVKSFGGQKLLTQANDMTAAVARFGGVAKLTSAEQTRINATVTAAIDKYRALGQQAPKAMLELQAATKGAAVATNTFGISLRQVQKIAATFGISLGVGSLIAFGRDLLQVGDELVRVADRTGLTTVEVQKLDFIAKQSGNSLDELTSAIGQLQNRLVGGDKGAIGALEKLGIKFDDIKRASPFEQLAMISDALRKIEDPAIRSRREFELFGRSGIAITPTLISQFRELGNQAPFMADATARALDRIGDELSKSKDQVKAWAADGFVWAFDLAGRAFDRFLILAGRGSAFVLDMLASMLELLQKLPGGAAVFKSLGISIEGVRKQAQWFRDANHATELQLERTVPEIRKNTGALGDYEDASDSAGKADTARERATSAAAKALAAQEKAARDAAAALRDRDAAARDQLQFEQTRLKEEGDSFSEEMARIRFENIQNDAAAENFFRIEQARLSAFGDTFADEMDQRRKTIEDTKKAEADFWAGVRTGAPEEARKSAWTDVADSAKDAFKTLDTAIAGSFAQMALGAKHFKDAFLDIWHSIQAALTRIFAEIAGSFISGMLKKMIAGAGGAAAAGALGGAAAGSAAAAVSGVEAAALGGGGAAAAGGGLGASVAAFATNPFTLAIAGGIGAFFLGRHLFGGGEEKQVNPRRDQFTGQFGGPQALAALLTTQTGKTGGGGLFAALQGANTIASFESAEKAILAFETNHGKRNVKLFNMGGFVPPGVTQPAILHGGSFGEDIVPRGTSSGAGTNISLTMNISAIDAKGVREFVESRDFTDSLDRAFVHNKRFLTTRVRSSLLP